MPARQEQPASRDPGPARPAAHDTPTEPREAAAVVRSLDEHGGPREPAGAPAAETRWVPSRLSLQAAYPTPALPDVKEALKGYKCLGL